MRLDVSRSGGFLAVALLCAFAVAPAVAQEAPDAAAASAAPWSASGDEADFAAETTLSPEDSALIGNVLMFDPADIARNVPDKKLRLPGVVDRRNFDVSGTGNPDGTGTVVLKQPLPSEWDAKVGADLDLGNRSADLYGPYKPPAASDGNGNGAAWASIGVQDMATVNARVDPRNDQGRLATTFSHSIPVGSRFSVTLQNTYSVTETYGQPQTAASGIPLMAAPAGDAEAVPRVFGKEGVAKLNILATGTTLGAGLSATNVDPVTHNKLSAEQKIYGPLNVTTAVTDIGQPFVNRSLTAGFKLTW